MHFPLIVIHPKGFDLWEALKKYDQNENQEFQDKTEELEEAFKSPEIQAKNITFEDYCSNWCGYAKKEIDGKTRWGHLWNNSGKFDSISVGGRFDGLLVDADGQRCNTMPSMDLYANAMMRIKRQMAELVTKDEVEDAKLRFPAIDSADKLKTLLGYVFTHVYDVNSDTWVEIDNVSFNEKDYETILLKKRAGFKKWGETLESFKKVNYDATLLDCHI